MLGNISSAGSVQIGAADSEGSPDVGNHLGGASTQGADEGTDGDCEHGSPDTAATDTVKLAVPSSQAKLIKLVGEHIQRGHS